MRGASSSQANQPDNRRQTEEDQGDAKSIRLRTRDESSQNEMEYDEEHCALHTLRHGRIYRELGSSSNGSALPAGLVLLR